MLLGRARHGLSIGEPIRARSSVPIFSAPCSYMTFAVGHSTRNSTCRGKPTKDRIRFFSYDSKREAFQLRDAHDLWQARSVSFTAPKQDGVTLPNSKDRASQAVKTLIQGRPHVDPTSEIQHDEIRAVGADKAEYGRASEVFSLNGFLYAADNFRSHPMNTLTPEICILGASNCGKSTFINALTNSPGLARTSDRAGKTITMNAYGIGPRPMKPPSLPHGSPEKPPSHSMVLVDTPGYGFHSQDVWGENILAYLSKRRLLRGVVLLLSAEKKLTAQDKNIIRLLRDERTRTLVVFTKTDKLIRQVKKAKTSQQPEKSSDEDRAEIPTWVESMAAKSNNVRSFLDKVGRNANWTCGDGWLPEIYLTAAAMESRKDWAPDKMWNQRGMSGVRSAILELAGINTRKRRPASPPDVGKAHTWENDPETWTGETVPFDEIEKKYGELS